MGVRVSGIRVELGGRLVVEGASLVAEPGQVVGLVGPNGSGKTTLLRTVFRAVRPAAGTVELAGDDLRSLSTTDVARRAGVLGQERTADFDLTVEEIVRMGRTPHQGLLAPDSAADRRIVAEAMRRVGVYDQRDTLMSSLSGGERQRVLVARTLAQQARVLLLDEPTNHLDIRHQLELLRLIRMLGAEHGVTTVAALHDLNLAASSCDAVYVLAGGRVVGGGPTTEVLRGDLLSEVFGVRVTVSVDPDTGRPRVHCSLPEPVSAPRAARTGGTLPAGRS